MHSKHYGNKILSFKKTDEPCMPIIKIQSAITSVTRKEKNTKEGQFLILTASTNTHHNKLFSPAS